MPPEPIRQWWRNLRPDAQKAIEAAAVVVFLILVQAAASAVG
jgi:hypothetical protein